MGPDNDLEFLAMAQDPGWVADPALRQAFYEASKDLPGPRCATSRSTASPESPSVPWTRATPACGSRPSSTRSGDHLIGYRTTEFSESLPYPVRERITSDMGGPDP
ncbi:MAG: hypothetical protein KDB60_19555 [Propionibacteriaceae bacterium]|nr:hypothetical protein [Propionibacteriaceae bacterium]